MPDAEPPTLPFASRDDWEAWLEAHQDDPDGVWIKIAKKASGIETVSHADALEVALCFGWIDGQRKGLDERWFLQRFTPRRARSRWSKINRDKATDLIERGLMRPAGLRESSARGATGAGTPPTTAPPTPRSRATSGARSTPVPTLPPHSPR